MKMKGNQGQALLPVLIIMVVVLILGAAVLDLSISGLLVSSYFQEGEATLMATEGALENGLLRILRNPSYSGESLQVGDASCIISISGQSPVVMNASCDSGRAIRRLQAEINFVAGEMIVDNILEIE